MAEELQLEIQSRIYAADWSLLERTAKVFKADIEGKTRLAVAKHVVQRLEEEIGKLGDTEIVMYLGDLKQLLTEQPSVGKKGDGKSGNPVISNVKQTRKTPFKNCWLLVLYVDNLRSVVKLGSLTRKIKSVSLREHVKSKRGWLKVTLRVKFLMVLCVRSHLVWYLKVTLKLIKT